MLDKENSIVLVIDVQEKLTGMLKDKSEIACKKAETIISVAKTLNIPIIITEQYPKGLGETISDIKDILGENYKPFEKTSFSAIREKEILGEIKRNHRKQIVLFGIEAHICVFQTALDLKDKGYQVFVVYDASYSRNEEEKELAMKNLNGLDILTPSVEMVLFMWLKNSKNPNFKDVQMLIK